ncbi:CpsD/CapB family tyrosine-protein kinase [Neobacillus sp. PS3-40]|uniref:CpsD/CapB family tyrosine-protein kinase n=1 Tax=Neobacillus sp. PS3-40 TaxID=3070679 RepID=UPI0027DEC5C3|nr:CpsD/CapB family tyrosine-protein kinase [Neobacillus sp. PS3-40]WML45831.1 CpsD/CapB family tyrosine-protein kinase [Neobacillus sp. PS3-40]
MNRRINVASAKKRMLIAYSHPESIFSEQFRMIQANINFAMEDKKSRTFLITSPCKGEGKSTLVSNLAVSMAQQKKKVLLIDGNLRTPNLHNIMKVRNTIGLTDVLTGKIKFEEAIIHTEIGELDVLTSGLIPVNPSELLGSQYLRDILCDTLRSYDMVLIDSYSVLELSDTKLLANQCDGVVLVIQNGKTLIDKAIEARKVLEFAKAKLIGVIMNK